MTLDRDPNHVFRDFVIDGLPSSGSWNPRKLEIRQLLTEWWQTLIALVADAGGLELPNLLISMTVTGGDENNIIAEANLPVPSSPGVAVFSIVIEEANTGPVTINGKPLLSNTGNPLAAGALAADGIYLFLDNGDSYRLLSDYVSSSIVAAAEAAQQAAENAQSAAEAARDAAEGAAETVVVARYNSKAGVEAATVDAAVQSIQLTGYYAAGDGGGALYKRVETEPAHAGKIQSADGAWWEIAEKRLRVEMFDDFVGALSTADSLGLVLELDSDAAVDSADVENVLSKLDHISVVSRGRVAINLPAGVFEFDSAIEHTPAGGADKLDIIGAEPVVANITAGSEPSITATQISGDDYYYDITFAVDDSSGFAEDDYVVVRVQGPEIDYSTNYDMTRDGCRVFELSGGGIVSAVATGTITVRNHHRNSSNRFPTGSAIKVTSGTITKYQTVLKFGASHGFNVGAAVGQLKYIAVVGDGSGTYNGILGSSYVDGEDNADQTHQDVGFSTYEVLTYNWGGPGIFLRGARARGTGALTTATRSGRQGIFARDGASASFPDCIVNATGQGGGTNIGYGFVAQGSSRMECARSIAVGNRNTGFYADFAGTMECPSSISMGNGNYAAEDGVQQEGKGYEAETGGIISCRGSVGCYNVSYGFYANAAAKMSADQCIGSHNMIGYGFYAIHVSEIYARQSVAIGNGENGNGVGFLARRGSRINAYDTRSSSNAQYDYRALDQSEIQVSNYLDGSSSFDPPLNWRKGNSRLSSIEGDADISANYVISSSAITIAPYVEYAVVGTGGAAANLDNINGAVKVGQMLTIRPSVGGASGTITVRHNQGNIRNPSGSNITLSPTTDHLMLVWRGDVWVSLNHADFA